MRNVAICSWLLSCILSWVQRVAVKRPFVCVPNYFVFSCIGLKGISIFFQGLLFSDISVLTDRRRGYLRQIQFSQKTSVVIGENYTPRILASSNYIKVKHSHRELNQFLITSISEYKGSPADFSGINRISPLGGDIRQSWNYNSPMALQFIYLIASIGKFVLTCFLSIRSL